MASFLRGLKDSLSIVVGYLPIAFSFGVLAVQLGVPAWQAVAISAVVYAGASQFVMVSLFAAGGSAWAVVGVVLLMNLRHVFYGPSLLARLSLPSSALPRALLAFGLTDEVFAIAIGRFERSSDPHPDRRLFGLQMGAYASWVLGTAAGAGLGAALGQQPAAIEQGFRFVLPALFFALLLELRRSATLPQLAGAAAATLAATLVAPPHLAMLLGMVAGATLGLATSGTPGHAR